MQDTHCNQSKRFEISTDKRLLALGAESSGVFCTVNEGKAELSRCYGNLLDQESFEQFRESALAAAKTIRPETILCDLHPQYNTTSLAVELGKQLGIPVIQVQHHTAHSYASMLEHGLRDSVSIVCDGMGYGSDGSIWGGEIIVGGKRVGHLQEQHLLGGDSATERPAKFLYSILFNSMSKRELHKVMGDHFKAQELELLRKQMLGRFNSPVTTSCGRVFDAAAVLLGICCCKEHSDSPAVQLEKASTEPYPLEPVVRVGSDGCDVLLTTPLFEFLVDSLSKPWADRARLAATVQQYTACGLYLIAKKHSDGRPILFTGGCANNSIMSSYLTSQSVLKNRNVDCGDDSIALGQAAWYAANP